MTYDDNLGEVIIIIDGGQTFEGTVEQYEDCFATNPNKYSIETQFAGSTIEYIPKSEYKGIKDA